MTKEQLDLLAKKPRHGNTPPPNKEKTDEIERIIKENIDKGHNDLWRLNPGWTDKRIGDMVGVSAYHVGQIRMARWGRTMAKRKYKGAEPSDEPAAGVIPHWTPPPAEAVQAPPDLPATPPNRVDDVVVLKVALARSERHVKVMKAALMLLLKSDDRGTALALLEAIND